jgi:branched-subunit amino acid transport protein
MSKLVSVFLKYFPTAALEAVITYGVVQPPFHTLPGWVLRHCMDYFNTYEI